MTAVTGCCLLFVPEAVFWSLKLTFFFAALFLLILFSQQKNFKNFKENLSENFSTGLLPILHLLPLGERKLVEMFVVLLIAGVFMGVTFAKLIPVIMKFWGGRYG